MPRCYCSSASRRRPDDEWRRKRWRKKLANEEDAIEKKVYLYKYVYIYIVIALDIVLSGSLNRFYGEKWVNAIIECAVQRRNRD